jgi:ligand-binding sensor domain-containing protein
MNVFLRCGVVLLIVAGLAGCSMSGKQNVPPVSDTAKVPVLGDLSYQDVLERGGTVNNLGMSDQQIVWVGTKAGLYQSADGGNWGLVAPELEYQDIVEWFVNPLNTREIIVAGQAGVMRSVDGGNHWTSIGEGLPVPAQIRCLAGYEKEGELHLFAFVSGEGIYESTDSGENWSLWLPMDQEVYAMDYDPREDRLYVAAQFSLFYYEDGEWKTDALPQAEQTYSLSVDRRTGVLAVATEQGVYEKIDGEWQLLDAKAPEKLIVVAPGEGETRWIGIGESALIYTLIDDKWTKWN